MKNFTAPLLACVLFMQMSVSHADKAINMIVLPDLFSCHQIGGEIPMTSKTTVGVLARTGCHTKRPAYGKSNTDVRNTFNRVLIPLRYAKEGVFQDSVFIQTLIGAESHHFRSTLGSRSRVVFAELALHAGYQWFWSSGFNISVLAGVAVLIKNHSKNDVVDTETESVKAFLNKNTATNTHGGAGVIFGWKF